MKLEPVNPNEIENVTSGSRGRISYPIIKMFMESNSPCSKLDRGGMQQSLLSLSSSIGAYIRNHGLPIKLIQRKGEIYLLRLDINADGSPNPEYKPGVGGQFTGTEAEDSVVDITPAAIETQYEIEKDQVTK